MDTKTRVLVYKQSVLPLGEYVSFMLHMNSKKDVDELQRFQNKSLRLCYDINSPRDIGIIYLHSRAKLDILCDRRDFQLLCLMYDLRKANKYNKNVNRATRARDGYVFETVIPKRGIYSRSPYYVGANMWQKLPIYIQNAVSKEKFKTELKGHWGIN